VTPVQSISETDIMPASHANTSYANTSYANILCQLMPTQLSNQILDHSVQNHPNPVSFLSSGVPS
jgi:hypothetical protein